MTARDDLYAGMGVNLEMATREVFDQSCRVGGLRTKLASLPWWAWRQRRRTEDDLSEAIERWLKLVAHQEALWRVHERRVRQELAVHRGVWMEES